MPDFARHYAASSDEALLRWADDVVNLVPAARTALLAEMQRRQLVVENVEWEAAPPTKPVRMGGWLWLYCIGSVGIYPIWAIANTIQKPAFGVILLPHAILQIGAGVMLWRRNPRGLRWLRWAFLYIGVLFILGLATVLIQGDLFKIGDYIGDTLVGAIPTVLWWFYFRRSKHVRQVYGRNMDGILRKKIPIADLKQAEPQ
jgi:hypothetical protein